MGCDVVNRGLAAWGNKLFLGSLDGRLIALDMTSGEEVWVTDTIESDLPYTITGAPRVTVWSSSAMVARIWAGHVAMSQPMTLKQVKRRGGSGRFRTIRRKTSLNICRWRLKPGRANGGKLAVAAPCGTPWLMTPSLISSISASATARRGTSI